MKTIILSLAVVLSFVQSYAQERIRPVHDKDYYIKTGRNLTTTAWVMVCAGPVIAAGGISIINNNKNSGDFNSGLSGVIGGLIITALGSAAIIASIPMFIVGGRMKKKAAMLSFHNQKILLPSQNSFVARIQPGVSLRIGL